MEGWVSIHRTLAGSDLWLSEPFTRGQAWVDLIMLANHEEGFIRVRGIKIVLNRGQIGWSEVRLSERWKWSRSKTRHFLKELENVQQIEQQKGNVSLIISVVNYESYQQKDSRKDSRRAAKVQQKDTNNNENNENNENNKEGGVKPSRFSPPSLIELQSYFSEKINEMGLNLNPKIEAEKFESYYGSINWMVGKTKMTNWKKSVSGWILRNNAIPIKQCEPKEKTIKAI